MAASGNKNLESKDQVIRIEKSISHPLFTTGYDGVVNHINEYSGFSYPSSAWIRFFGSSSLQEEILMLARYAAPLDIVEARVRKAHAREETHLPDTLIQATVQAIRDGDVTLTDDRDVVICEGMAERLMGLCKVLCPDIFPKCLEQARIAAPLETEKQKDDRERLNQDAIKQVFDAIKKNNKDTAEAIKNFKEWAKKTSVLNRIHLIDVAREELAKKGGELPRVDARDGGNWIGVLGDRFCFEVIGDALQKNLPPRMQQILQVSPHYIFNRTKELVRFTDLDTSSFIGPRGSVLKLGVTAFYDGFGLGWRGVMWGIRGNGFQNMLRAITAAFKIYYTPTSVSPSEPVSDNVGIRRSPAATAAAQ